MKSPFDPSTDPRVQEALSRKYGNDVILLLPLKGGQIAVFNNARELCGILSKPKPDRMEYDSMSVWDAATQVWHPPTAIEPAPTPKATLDDLELL